MTWVLRASDDGAITFYKKLGFTQSAVALERAGDKTAFASAQVDTLAVEFGITRELVDHRGLLEYQEATDLVSVGVNSEGREHRLTPAAAQAWFGMQTAAATSMALNWSSCRLFAVWRGRPRLCGASWALARR